MSRLKKPIVLIDDQLRKVIDSNYHGDIPAQIEVVEREIKEGNSFSLMQIIYLKNEKEMIPLFEKNFTALFWNPTNYAMTDDFVNFSKSFLVLFMTLFPVDETQLVGEIRDIINEYRPLYKTGDPKLLTHIKSDVYDSVFITALSECLINTRILTYKA